MWVQMRALEMFGTFMPLLFMIGVWKCHLDTWLCPRITSHVWFGGGHVGPDDGYEDVWISHVIVVHDRGLEVSS